MKILIADAGATKTNWISLLYGDFSNCKTKRYSGVGVSPLHHDTYMIEEELRLVRTALGKSFDRIRFYGAGIGTPEIAGKMETFLSEMFDCADIKADSDMAGAAYALLGDHPGIACIMGTGSNSCHYDGVRIDRKAASLGYLLDDEGGGIAYARRLLSDIYKGVAPQDIVCLFNERYHMSVSEVVDSLYRKPSPNRWIAGFMPFIIENISHPYIGSLVESQIERFFDREFLGYSDEQLREEGIGFVGSVADELKYYIQTAIHKRGWRLRGVVRNPIDSLVKLHKTSENHEH